MKNNQATRAWRDLRNSPDDLPRKGYAQLLEEGLITPDGKWKVPGVSEIRFVIDEAKAKELKNLRSEFEKTSSGRFWKALRELRSAARDFFLPQRKPIVH